MKLSQFIEGLQILQRYYDHDNYCLGAEHDQLFLYATNKPLNEYDFNRLIDLGWFQPDQESKLYDYYDQEKSWSLFV